MAVTTFIPELWSARLLHQLDKSHVAANLVNRDYEGVIKKQGDTVHINSIGAVTIKDYVKANEIASPEELTTTDQTLVVDQAKYFNFMINDVDAAQAAGNLMDEAMRRSAYGLKDASDAYLLKTIATGAAAANQIATVALTASNIYENIIKLRTLMDKNNCPTEGRTLVVPPEAYALLLQDNRFTGNGGVQAEKTVRNGMIGRVAGFDVFESNNCHSTTASSVTTYCITAQTRSACTFAEQIVETKAYSPEKRFADAVKGLYVYGAKVTDSNQVAVLKCTF